ncbi:hypothetical protein DN062_03965 [Nitrincola tibetensis]|uniref:Transposase InsH N-terminal domain-containing protein n=1 Tax=Nitrincola tibetensis TaxID=2219697 RepID=A0A364NQR7_9GAMM|nr:hypothetical protein DN062_03965 [Nitrincola tibetensis]
MCSPLCQTVTSSLWCLNIQKAIIVSLWHASEQTIQADPQRNDDNGAPAYDPTILLKVVLFACFRVNKPYSKGRAVDAGDFDFKMSNPQAR